MKKNLYRKELEREYPGSVINAIVPVSCPPFAKKPLSRKNNDFWTSTGRLYYIKVVVAKMLQRLHQPGGIYVLGSVWRNCPGY